MDDKPVSLPHEDDVNNRNRFVRAVDQLYAGGGHATQGYPDIAKDFNEWVHYNRTVNFGEGSEKPPNRRRSGNRALWPQRRRLAVYPKYRRSNVGAIESHDADFSQALDAALPRLLEEAREHEVRGRAILRVVQLRQGSRKPESDARYGGWVD